jgi:hypothetical protein
VNRRTSAAVACAVAFSAFAPLGACSRHADLLDEYDAVILNTPRLPEAGPIPALDSGIGSDAFAGCADRSAGTCRGPVDFPCDFDRWVQTTAAKCQQATGCRTNGWLRVRLDAGGCVDEIGMDQPNDAILACLLSDFGSVRCPCSSIEMKVFFGLANGFDAGDGGFCPGPHG